MKKKIHYFLRIVLLASCIAFVGIVIIWKFNHSKTEENFQKLRKNLSKGEVYELLGKPDNFNSNFDSLKIWTYELDNSLPWITKIGIIKFSQNEVDTFYTETLD